MENSNDYEYLERIKAHSHAWFSVCGALDHVYKGYSWVFGAGTGMYLAVKAIIDLKKEIESKQAKIDALMLEYCPDEMTPEQMKEWESRQKLAEVLGEQCLDGGKCHHQCKKECFRRVCCEPFTDYTSPWKYGEVEEDEIIINEIIDNAKLSVGK